MLTFVVLGNPGDEYKDTRHNSGRVVFDEVMRTLNLPSFVSSSRYGGQLSEGVIDGREVRVVYPDTYMNHSGEVAKKLLGNAEIGELVVVYDEVDVPLGEIKVSFGRGAGGHNGLASVINELGSKEFWRIRIGIAPKSLFGKTVRPVGEKLQRYVLGRLSKREQDKLMSTKEVVLEAVQKLVKEV